MNVTELSTAFSRLLSEKDVLNQYQCLSIETLRTARNAGIITWVRGKRGTAWYRRQSVEKYIEEHLEKRCREHACEVSSNSADTGSQQSQIEHTCTISGLTPEMVELAGAASARRILNKQN